MSSFRCAEPGDTGVTGIVVGKPDGAHRRARVPDRAPVEGSSTGPRCGFTLIEVIVVLAVVAALTAILTPMVVRYVDDARSNRSQADVKVMGSSVGQFFRDVGKGPVFSNATAVENRAPDISVLYGPGTNPTVASGVTGWVVDASAGNVEFDPATTDSVDAIADQLISNEDDGGSDIYATSPPAGVRPGQGQFWQGPYLEEAGVDPWGQRYLMSVRGFGAAPDQAAFVISAGPNGLVETNGDQGRSGELTVSGDDRVFRIR